MSCFKIVNKETASAPAITTSIAQIKGAKTATEFYQQLAQGFSFPDYFGENLDALFDCINDLDWLETTDLVIQIEDYDVWLSEEDDEFKEDVMALLFESSLLWKEGENGEVKHLTVEIFESNKSMEDLERWGIGE